MYSDKAAIDGMTRGETGRFLVRSAVDYLTVPRPWTIESRAALAFVPELMFWYCMLALLPIGLIAALRRDAVVTMVLAAYAFALAALVAVIGRQYRHACPASRAGAALSDLAERCGSRGSADVRGSNDEEGSGMALVDDRGQVFGRFNPVDVFVFVLVVVMIPIAYGAYALFRTPQAKLASVDPKQFTVGPNLRVRVNGTNLRPFMRVSFNTVQGRTFMIGSTETADVDLPDLEPGSYDIVLYDYAQEVDRLPKALTILPRVARANR